MADYASFNDAGATRVITQTITGSASHDEQTLANDVRYVEEHMPVAYRPRRSHLPR